MDDYLCSPEGTKNLAASCMLIEAIGEAFKKVDKATDGTLLSLYPSIPWKAVKGIRDRIAYGYFEIDADIIYETVKRICRHCLMQHVFVKKVDDNWGR